MKKIIVSMLFLAMAMPTIMSCKKESNSENVSKQTVSTNSNYQLRSDLMKINAKYINSNSKNLKTTAPSDKGARAWATAGADAVAVGGVLATCSGWMALGPIGGMLAGGFAAVSGATASYGMYKTCGGKGIGTGPFPLLTEQQVNSAIVAHTGPYSFSNPNSNPWEFVGVRHNELVQILCAKTSPNSITSTYGLYDYSDLTSDEIASFSLDTPDNMISHYNFVSTYSIPQNNMASALPFVDYAVPYANYPDINDALVLFTTGLEAIDNYNDGMTFITDYEAYFLGSPAVSTADKNTMQATLAVAKHSLALWYDALPF